MPASAPAGTDTQDIWPHWQAIIYQPQTDAQLVALKRLGVTNGMLYGSRNDGAGNPRNPEAARFARHGMRFYVENIATDFYSAYHRWRPNQPDDAAFLAVQALHRRAPDDVAAFIREPGLSDPVWLRRIDDRLTRTVHDYARFKPLYYSLADEPGIADLAANWDFDLSPSSLAGMRAWLRGEYVSLAALNRQWGTGFVRWADVMPSLTDAAVRQRGENFSAWADFKRWMDVAFARAVRTGTNAVHAAVPRALAAIEGAQIPGWGGYNYAGLAGAVDVMEIYDAGEAIEIARSMNPSLVMLMTFSNGDSAQMHRLWRSVLQGMRGAILWDEHNALVGKDGTIGPWGRQAAPVFSALRGRLGRLLVGSERVDDGIATLYSPASLRTQWLLDRRAGWGRWENRSASAETNGNDAVQAALRRFARRVVRARVQGHYTAPAPIERGALRTGRIRVLLLPHVIALSAKAAVEIRHFIAAGGTVVADVPPGQFDEHSRRLPHPRLADLFPSRAARAGPGSAILWDAAGAAGVDNAASLFARIGLHVRFSIEGLAGRAVPEIVLFRFRSGNDTILALHRQFDATASTEPVMLKLDPPGLVQDVQTGEVYGMVRAVKLHIDPVTPTILMVTEGSP